MDPALRKGMGLAAAPAVGSLPPRHGPEAAIAIPDDPRKTSAMPEIAEAAFYEVFALLFEGIAGFGPSKAFALREIADAQAKVGDLRGALETAAAIPDASRKASALREIAAAQAMAGNSKEAARTFDQALEAARAIADNLDRAIAVALIAADRSEAHDVQGALAWAATLSGDPVAKVSVLVGVAAGVLQPTGRLGSRSATGLLPRWSNF